LIRRRPLPRSIAFVYLRASSRPVGMVPRARGTQGSF